MTGKLARYNLQVLEPMIPTIRGQKVVLDMELARIYGVTTKVFNQAVKRNKRKFPADFMFQLTVEEYENLRSQIVTSRCGPNRSQFATGSHGGRRYLPYVFTEHGAVMVANILRSDRAIQMSVFVVRAFIKIREMAIAHRELSQRIDELERRLNVHDEQTQGILKAIRQLMAAPEKPSTKIGFHLREKRAAYKSL